MRLSRLTSLAITIVVAASVSLLHAHLAGPPPGYSGAPGDETCGMAGCHDSPPPNLMGSVFVSGIATQDTNELLMNVSERRFPGSVDVWGFQVTILDTAGKSFGTLLIRDSATTQMVVDSLGRQYLTHTADGTIGIPGHGRWTWPLAWVRPRDRMCDSILIYSAGVLSNDDGTATGDLAVTRMENLRSCLIKVDGDVNTSGSVTSADIVFLVGFIFTGHIGPRPCEAAGDVNCDGVVTSADIIYLVNFVFKGDIRPCDICRAVCQGLVVCW